MFNSQKINNDPKPWRFVHSNGSETRVRDASGYEELGWEYDPRVEYDNQPNPILVEFRYHAHQDWTGRGTAWLARHWTSSEYMWQEMCLSDDSLSDEPLGTPEQEDHARKVLTRLVNIFGTEEP